LIDVLGFVQRNGVRGAIDRLGQFFLPFLHLAIQPNDHIVLYYLPLDGDRAKLGPVDSRPHA